MLSDLEYVVTCEVCPTQLEGRIAGRPFYFRYRWGGWQLHVAATDGGDVWDAAAHVYSRDGWGEPMDGWMSIGEAVDLIDGYGRLLCTSVGRKALGLEAPDAE